ncbi:MAG: class I SAM-dependent methyltransferase [bacterium]|nr:class I SAM-dependent methyltransferase [bacterium]
MNGEHSLPADFRGIIEESGHRAIDEDIEGVPEWERFRVISDKVGLFLYILARSTWRKRSVELAGKSGTSSSTIWLAGAANQIEGEVISWETNPRRLVQIQNALSRARLSPNVEIRTTDPIWQVKNQAGVIAPPALDQKSESENSTGSSLCDFVLIAMEEGDWAERLTYAWDILEPGGLMILIDTIEGDEAGVKFLNSFFATRQSAVVGIELAEGIVLAFKLSDEKIHFSYPSDERIVGRKASDVLYDLEIRNRKPGSRLWAIPPITGRLLWILVRAMKAKHVLEIGASSGYSGTWIAKALEWGAGEGGKLTTIELDPEKVRMARDTYVMAGVSERVEVIHGDALEVLPNLNDMYDLVFLDCDKEYYLDLSEPILLRLRRGGLLIADNVVSHREVLKQYSDFVQNHSCLASLTVPTGSGLEMTMVL